MERARAVLLLLMLSIAPARAADDPAITACEETLKNLIKSPATYKRARADIFGRRVILSFDSQNGFGALIRSAAECLFHFDEDRYVVSSIRVDGEYVDIHHLRAARMLAVDDAKPIPQSVTKLRADP